MKYNNEEQDELQKKFELFIKSIAENIGQKNPELSSLPPISGSTRKNRLFPYINISQSRQAGVPLDDFIMQAAIALRDEFADCYITMQEGNNNLIIELSNHEFFQVQITKLNAEDMK